VSLNLKLKSGKYILTIKDTGIGISQEYMVKMFDAFTQESEGYTKKYQGIGLGMSIAKRHLDMNHVSIRVESQKGTGTTFTLTFAPAEEKAPEPPEDETEAREVKTAAPANRPLILLVENDPTSRKLVKHYLQNEYDIRLADSVDIAKKQLKKHPVKLILLDLSLKGNEDGLVLVRYLRKKRKWRNLPVIALTAHAFTTDQKNCLSAGCNDYLSKPVSRDSLIEKIRHLLNGDK
jgi:CheY-like chemotaxis protein